MDLNGTIRRYCGHSKAIAGWVLANAESDELARLEEAASVASRPGVEVAKVVDEILARVKADKQKATIGNLPSMNRAEAR